MADRSAIEWTDASWNPIRARRRLQDGTILTGWHCEHASEGCRFCYAEGFNRRLGTKLPYKPGHLHTPQRPQGEVEIFLDEKMLLLPLKWKQPRTIFLGSMTDVGADFVTDEMLDQIFAVAALTPQHIYQVLTKRMPRMRRYVTAQAEGSRHVTDHVDRWQNEGLIKPVMRDWIGSPFRPRPLPNVWLGTSIEDRAALLERAGHLRKTPAAVRFFSCEPLLGDLGQVVLDDIDWVICGGESGPGARPMHPDWARSLRDQCAAAGVPFFFKQWGEWGPDVGPLDQRDRQGIRRDPVMEGAGPCAAWTGEGWRVERDGYAQPLDGSDREWVYRLGKKRNGRLLDGIGHDGMPGVRA